MNSKPRVIRYLAAFIAIVIILAVFVLAMTRLAGAYDQGWKDTAAGDSIDANIRNQFLAVIALFLMGLIALFPLNKKIGVTQVLLLSYPVGLLGFSLISILLLTLHVYFSLLSVLAVYCAALAAIYIAVIKKKVELFNLGRDNVIKIAFWGLTLLAIGLTLSAVPISNVSFDSIQYRLLGKAYAVEHHFASYFYYEMAGRAFIPALLSAISVFFKFDYAYAVQNMFLLNSILLFGYLLFRKTREDGVAFKPAVWMALLGTAMLATSFFVLFLGITLVPNIFTAFCFCFMMVYIYRYILKKQVIDLALSFFFMLAFCFTRVEAPLVAAFLLAYLAHQDIKTRPVLAVIGGLLFFLMLWYTSFMLHVGADYEGRFLTFGKSMINVVLLILVGVYTAVKNRWFKKYNDRLLILFVCAVVVFTLGASLLDIEKLKVNAFVMYLNMFAEGMWMTAWFAAGVFGLIAMIISRKKDHILEGFIPIYLILIIAVFAFRGDNLHINWSDSGNRLLMHIYPLTVFAIADNIISYFSVKK